jgi:hypothetical protein
MLTEPKASPDRRTGKPAWLANKLRHVGFVTVLRERLQVRRTCVETLKLYREAEAALPGAGRRERYEWVVARRTGSNPAGVRAVLEHAEDSFAAWPIERPLTFRDVVQYLAITECLTADPTAGGVRTHVADRVAGLIPANL